MARQLRNVGVGYCRVSRVVLRSAWNGKAVEVCQGYVGSIGLWFRVMRQARPVLVMYVLVR